MLLQNPKIDRWWSFLTRVDLRIKSASKHLKMIFDTGKDSPEKKTQGTESPTKQESMNISLPLEMTGDLQRDLNKNIEQVEMLIGKVAEISRNSKNLQHAPQTVSLFKQIGLPSEMNSDENQWDDSKIPGKIATLFFNNTLNLLGCVDDIICKLNGPEKYREILASLLFDSQKNLKFFYQVRQRKDLPAIQNLVHQEIQVQNNIVKAVKNMNFMQLTR